MGLSMPSITFDKGRNSWLARVRIAGVQRTLGRFPTKKAALEAVDAALKEAAVTEAARIKTTWVPVPDNWQKLKYHKFACVLPFEAGIEDGGLDKTTAHMRNHGYDESDAIIVWRESPKKPFEIVAGRLRHQCAIQAGVTPSFRQLEGNLDAVKAIALKDANRRHYTASQRALLIATLGVDLCKEIDKDPPTQSQMAEEAGVSRPIMNDAVKVVKKATEALKEAAGAGVISVQDAAKVADKPAEVQNQAVADVKAGKTRTAAASANGHANGKPAAEKPDPETPEGNMKAVNSTIESFCRRLMDFVKENLPEDHWLNDDGVRDGAVRKFEDGCSMLRRKKCVALCPKCGGTGKEDGKKCRPCHGTGRLPKLNLDMI